MEGIFRNKWFIGIQLIIIGGQILIIFFGGAAFSVQRLDQVSQWAVSLVLGAFAVPVALIIRLVPDEFIQRLIPHLWSRKKGHELSLSREGRHYEWNPALEEIRTQLKFMMKIRGGRLKHIKHSLQHPQDLLPQSRINLHPEDSSISPTVDGGNSETDHLVPQPAFLQTRVNPAFGPAAVMAGVVAGSIAGWSPIEWPHGEPGSIIFSSNGSHGRPDQHQGTEVHTNTATDGRMVGGYLTTIKTPSSQSVDLVPFSEHAPSPVSERTPLMRGCRSSLGQSRV